MANEYNKDIEDIDPYGTDTGKSASIDKDKKKLLEIVQDYGLDKKETGTVKEFIGLKHDKNKTPEETMVFAKSEPLIKEAESKKKKRKKIVYITLAVLIWGAIFYFLFDAYSSFTPAFNTINQPT